MFTISVGNKEVHFSSEYGRFWTKLQKRKMKSHPKWNQKSQASLPSLLVWEIVGGKHFGSFGGSLEKLKVGANKQGTLKVLSIRLVKSCFSLIKSSDS